MKRLLPVRERGRGSSRRSAFISAVGRALVGPPVDGEKSPSPAKDDERLVYVLDPRTDHRHLVNLDKEDLLIRQELRIGKQRRGSESFDQLLKVGALIGVLWVAAGGRC